MYNRELERRTQDKIRTVLNKMEENGWEVIARHPFKLYRAGVIKEILPNGAITSYRGNKSDHEDNT